MNEPPLHVWVFANMNGKISCCHCTCIAGLSETCSHVGAICYAIANLWDSNETVCKYSDLVIYMLKPLILEICDRFSV